jgi:hypothetical protein
VDGEAGEERSGLRVGGAAACGEKTDGVGAVVDREGCRVQEVRGQKEGKRRRGAVDVKGCVVREEVCEDVRAEFGGEVGKAEWG